MSERDCCRLVPPTLETGPERLHSAKIWVCPRPAQVAEGAVSTVAVGSVKAAAGSVGCGSWRVNAAVVDDDPMLLLKSSSDWTLFFPSQLLNVQQQEHFARPCDVLARPVTNGYGRRLSDEQSGQALILGHRGEKEIVLLTPKLPRDSQEHSGNVSESVHELECLSQVALSMLLQGAVEMLWTI